MPLPAAFLDELRARTSLATLIGRRVKLEKAGRQWKGCCPFHNERTPSFYVYDDGFHCFGCGAHGDAISFVMQTEGAGFGETVARLAAEAGIDVPKPPPTVAAAERRRADQHAVLEAVIGVYRRRLRAPEAATALAYLRGRGLDDATIEAWQLGWSGGKGRALASELSREGITPAMLEEVGVLRPAESQRPAADFFFNRVMFPIRDAQGRAIGLGGRVLGDGHPKYLNSPETPLFSKRLALFGLDRARGPARSGEAVLAVEGYLDVIALHQAGFAGAVAPLGTAISEAQLDALWRLSPTPILCFDGDAAGARAAARAARLALPLLTPERGLKVLRLPASDDPDSFVRRHGADAFRHLLEAAQARPFADTLYDLLREGPDPSTPEQRAAFRERLEAAARSIRHGALAREYRVALLERFFGARRRAAAPARPAGVRPRCDAGAADLDRFRILFCLLLNHPSLLRDEEECFSRLMPPAALQTLQGAMLAWVGGARNLDAEELMNHLRLSGCAGLAEDIAVAVAAALPAGARPSATLADAQTCFWHFVGLLERSGLEAELAEAQRALALAFDEAAQRRLIALRSAQTALFAAHGHDG